MVSALAVWWGAELRFPLLHFAHRHPKLLDLGTSLTSAGDVIQVGAWCFPFVFSPKPLHLFSGADLHGEESSKKLLGSKPKSEVNDCIKWKGLWARVWVKGRAGRWTERRWLRANLLCRQSGPVLALLCLICSVLWRLPWLCQMGFSVVPCWSCQFFMLHKLRFVFWSKAGDSCAEEPRCESREQSLPRLMPCSMFGWELFHTAAPG